MFPSSPSRIAAAASRVGSAISRNAARGALVATALAVSACNTNNVLSLRPDVDVGMQTAAVSGGGLQDIGPEDPYLSDQSADAAPVDAAPEYAAPVETAPGETDQVFEAGQPVDMAAPGDLAPPADADSVDEEQPVVAMHPVDVAQPSVIDPYDVMQPADAMPADAMPADSMPADAMQSGDVMQPVDTMQPPDPGEIEQPVAAEENTPILAAYPRIDNPVAAPRSVMPSEEAACRRELKRLGVVYKELPPIDDGGSCRIDHPIKVSQLPGRVTMKPAATLNCRMAATFARWTKKELTPAARLRYFSSVKTIHQASSYSCRRINGSRSMSEHSKGNALDISRIELKNGRDIDVRKPGLFAFRTRGFLNNVRTDGCDYFSTVLGPGYNHDHRDHFHFDIKPRRKGRVACH